MMIRVQHERADDYQLLRSFLSRSFFIVSLIIHFLSCYLLAVLRFVIEGSLCVLCCHLSAHFSASSVSTGTPSIGKVNILVLLLILVFCSSFSFLCVFSVFCFFCSFSFLCFDSGFRSMARISIAAQSTGKANPFARLVKCGKSPLVFLLPACLSPQYKHKAQSEDEEMNSREESWHG